jgi:hypothetical protein
MSKPISSTPPSHPQAKTDIETSSLVRSPSASEQSSASEDGSEKSAKTPVMKTRQTSDAALTTPATQNTSSSAPPQTGMTSSSPNVKNRPTIEERKARYRENRNLLDHPRDIVIKKEKTVKQGGAADIQQGPKPDGRWDQFTQALATDGKLTKPIFSENEMSELVAWLRTSPVLLRELVFVHLGNSTANVIALADALRGNTTLIKLEIIGNRIGGEGAAALADTLRVNTALTELCLSLHQIGDRGAAALADALRTNTTLTTLDLTGNGIGEEGASSLAVMLTFNTTLTSLNVCFGSKFQKDIDDLLEGNKRLKLQPFAKASLDLIFKHSPAIREVGLPADVIPVLAQQLSTEVLAVFEQEWRDAFRAPPPPVITTTTNATITTTTTTTTDATIPTTVVTPPAATATSPASAPPVITQPTATAADIKALLDDPNPVVALSRWIDGHANMTAALNWVDPANGYTLLHYAVAAQQGAVVRSLLARNIDRTRSDQNNQTAAQLAQQRADSSSSSAVAAIAALFK